VIRGKVRVVHSVSTQSAIRWTPLTQNQSAEWRAPSSAVCSEYLVSVLHSSLHCAFHVSSVLRSRIYHAEEKGKCCQTCVATGAESDSQQWPMASVVGAAKGVVSVVRLPVEAECGLPVTKSGLARYHPRCSFGEGARRSREWTPRVVQSETARGGTTSDRTQTAGTAWQGCLAASRQLALPSSQP
jgi:hypothetical protein